MNAKTKWIGAGAVLVMAAAAIFWLGRGDDAGSREPNGQPLEAPAAPAHVAVHPAPVEPPVAAPPPPAPVLPPVTAAPQPGRPAGIPPYRPAHLLIYSEEQVSQSPGGDNGSPMLARLIAVTEADPSQVAKIRELWAVHEEGRRKLWAAAYPSKSFPRQLDVAGVAQLDFAFQLGLLGQVLRPEQGQRLLEEVPPPPNNR